MWGVLGVAAMLVAAKPRAAGAGHLTLGVEPGRHTACCPADATTIPPCPRRCRRGPRRGLGRRLAPHPRAVRAQGLDRHRPRGRDGHRAGQAEEATRSRNPRWSGTRSRAGRSSEEIPSARSHASASSSESRRRALWARAMGSYMEYPPSYCDGTLYVNTFRGRTAAFDARTGKLRWSRKHRGAKHSTPAIAGAAPVRLVEERQPEGARPRDGRSCSGSCGRRRRSSRRRSRSATPCTSARPTDGSSP